MKITPAQRLRRLRAYQELREGTKVIPLTCAYCESSSLRPDESPGLLECLACGRVTKQEVAHQKRQKKMREYITNDLPISPVRMPSPSQLPHVGPTGTHKKKPPATPPSDFRDQFGRFV